MDAPHLFGAGQIGKQLERELRLVVERPQDRGHVAFHGLPPVALPPELGGLGDDPVTQVLLLEEADTGGRQGLGLVGDEEVPAVDHVDPLAAHGRADDR